MECPPIRAQAWLDDHERELQGLEPGDAVALIESAGLHAQLVPLPGGWSAQEQRDDRISLWLTESGAIGALDAG